MSRYVYDSVPYTLRLSVDESDKQARAKMPAICYREGATEKSLPALVWGVVKPRFQPYLVAVMQVLCKLCALYTKNEYGLQGLAYTVGTGNDAKWANCTALAHQMPRGEKLLESMQHCYYEEGFKVWTKDADRKQKRESSGASGSGESSGASGSGL